MDLGSMPPEARHDYWRNRATELEQDLSGLQTAYNQRGTNNEAMMRKIKALKAVLDYVVVGENDGQCRSCGCDLSRAADNHKPACEFVIVGIAKAKA